MNVSQPRMYSYVFAADRLVNEGHFTWWGAMPSFSATELQIKCKTCSGGPRISFIQKISNAAPIMTKKTIGGSQAVFL